MYGFKSSQTENCVEFIAGVPWKFYHSCAFSDNLHFSNTSAIIFWLMSNASSVNRVLNSRIPISYYDRFKFPSTVLDVWTSNLRFNLRFFIPSGAFWTLYCFIEGTSADTLLLLLFKLSLLLLGNNPLPTLLKRGDDALLVCVSKMSVQMAVSGRVSSICDNSLSEMRPFPLKSKSWKIILSSLSWPSKQYFSRIQKLWFQGILLTLNQQKWFERYPFALLHHHVPLVLLVHSLRPKTLHLPVNDSESLTETRQYL